MFFLKGGGISIYLKTGSQTPIVAGAITGVVHCTVEFPSDVVKARMQTNLNLTYVGSRIINAHVTCILAKIVNEWRHINIIIL